MNDYAAQWNQIRRTRKAKKAKTVSPEVEVSPFAWIILLLVGGIADLLGPFGFPFATILCLWYFFKFRKFPTKKLAGSGLIELVSVGVLPGWLGFVLATYIELKLAKRGINLPIK